MCVAVPANGPGAIIQGCYFALANIVKMGPHNWNPLFLRFLCLGQTIKKIVKKTHTHTKRISTMQVHPFLSCTWSWNWTHSLPMSSGMKCTLTPKPLLNWDSGKIIGSRILFLATHSLLDQRRSKMVPVTPCRCSFVRPFVPDVAFLFDYCLTICSKTSNICHLLLLLNNFPLALCVCMNQINWYTQSETS